MRQKPPPYPGMDDFMTTKYLCMSV